MSIDKAIEVILRLNDSSFKSALGSAQTQLRSFGDSMTRIGQSASVAFLGLGGIVAASANSFREFEKGMSNISTIVDTSKESIAKMGNEVLDLSKRMPVGINDLVAGLYDLRSAGIDGAHAMGALEASAKLGVAGLGSTAESVDLMTTAMNAFSDEGLSANTIADILFKTTQYGKNTISDLSEAFGNTAPLVKGAGVSLSDFMASTAALTAVGVPASEAMNSIRAAVVAMKKPTEEMDKVFKALHVSSGPELVKVSGNLGAAFAAVKDKAAELGIPLEKVTGRVEGAAAMTSLATNANATYVKSLGDMTSGANSLDQAFAKQAATFDSAIQLMINNVQRFAIQIGAAMAPALTVAANAIRNVADWFTKLPEPVKQFIAAGLLATTVITGIVAGSTLLIGSIAGSIASIISLTSTIGGWIAANAAVIEGASYIAAFLTGALLQGIVVIGSAVAALALAWNTNFLNIQTITKQTAGFIGLVMGDLFGAIGKWYQKTTSDSAKTMSDIGRGVSSFLTSVGQAVSPFFNWIGGLLNSLAKGVFSVIGGIANYVLNALIQTAKNAANVVNPFLQQLNLPTINVDGMVNSVKLATDGAIKYFKTKWAEAGKLSISAPKIAVKAPSSAGAIPTASPGGTPYVAPSDEDKKKAAKTTKRTEDKTEELQLARMQSLRDALAQSIKNHALALDEETLKLGLYANEGKKLSLVLEKLKSDQQSLQSAESKLTGVQYKGEAEKQRLKDLQSLKNQIRENAIEQIKVDNDLTKQRIDNAQRLKETELKINENRLRLRVDYLNKVDDYEIQHLKDQLDKKEISEKEYNDRVIALKEQQSNREIELTGLQITALKLKKQALEDINGVTPDSAGLQVQIDTLQSKIDELKLAQENQQPPSNSGQAGQGFDPFVAFSNSTQQALDSFNQNFLQGLLNGNLQIADSFKNLGASILSDFEGKIYKKLSDGMFTFINSVLTGNKTLANSTTQVATGLAASLHGIFSKMGNAMSEIFAGIASFAIGSFKTIFNAQKMAAVKGAILTANTSAMKAYDAVVGIPVVGPFLAPAAYAAALGFQLAKAAIIGGVSLGFAAGTPELPSDMVANVHKGEMIIPATFAQGIRSGELTLGGPGQKPAQEGRNVAITVNFDGAQFYGDMDRMVAEIERKLVEKLNIVGGRLALGTL